MLQKIVLHGKLKKEFGGPFNLDVATPAEAVQALTVLRPGFADAIRAGSWRVIRGPLKGGRALTAEQLLINLGGEMHLIAAPAGSGRGGGGTAKVVIGVTILAIALAPLTGGGSLAGVAFGQGVLGSAAGLGLGITAGQAALFGASLIFAGASQLLSPQPKAQQAYTPQDVKASHLFSGSLNSPDQGVPVPLCFGETRAGGVLISLIIETEDIAV
jgi:predicted phage tail protein